MFVKTHLGRECADRVDDALEVAYDEARLLRQAVEGRRKLRLLLLHDAVCRGHGVKVTAREGAPPPPSGRWSGVRGDYISQRIAGRGLAL